MATSSNFSTSNQYIKYRIVVTENSYSIPNNTSSVNVKVDAWRTNTGYTTSGTGTCYCTINGTKYSASISSTQSITHNSHTVLFNRTVTIPHNADGSKTIAVSAYIDHSRFSSSSQGFNVKLTTIPRQANLVSAPDFYDTDNPTITYSNPAGDIAAMTSLQACISLNGSRDDIAYRDISKTGTSYTFNLTQAERNVLLSACPNSNTLSVIFYIKTELSGQTYYSTLTRTMTVKNANPTITGSSYEDTNSTTTAITNNNQQIIQGISTVAFNFSSLAALKYATLTKIDITVNAVTVSANLSGPTVLDKTVSFGAINSSSNLSASIKLTDSRGNSTTQSLPIIMLAWSLPAAIITRSRKNNYYDETTLKVDATYSSLDNKNTITIQYQYKKVIDSSWSAAQTAQDNVPVTINLDNRYQWNIKVIVTDRIGSTTYNLTVDRGIPITFFDRLRRSVGVNTFPNSDETLEVEGDLLVNNHSINGDLKLVRTGGGNTRQIKGEVGTTDAFRLAGGADNNDVGFTELSTSGDGNEPIYARQYSGDFNTPVNTLELLDANGDTKIPNNLYIGGNIIGGGSSLIHRYTTTEQIVAYWVDDRPIYEKTVILNTTKTIPSNSWTDLETFSADITPLDVVGYSENSAGRIAWGHLDAQFILSSKKLQVLNIRSGALTLTRYVVQYMYDN